MAEKETSPSPAAGVPDDLRAAADALLGRHQRSIWARADRLFAGLLTFEWLAGITLACTLSPRTWAGATSALHPHVWAAIFLGGLIAAWPAYAALAMPARASTRHAIALAQMLMSALLIHIGNGRIEMHFHVFGSLAFLAFYRDWKVLVTATAVVVVDHLFRGMIYPESVYGAAASAGWRTLEHAGWVVFEDVFLIASCLQGAREMRGIADGRAQLEASHRDVEEKVRQRTAQLKDAQDELVKSARSAGMAEIATSVLHNVGNVLNSVNVSANLVADKLAQSEVASLVQVSQMVREHEADLGQYVTQDERGKLIPGFLTELAGCLEEEQKMVLAEVASLSKGIDHIKHIVAAQQTMAKRTTVLTTVRPADLMESALTMQSVPVGSRKVKLERAYSDAPAVEVDQHKVLQILINLIANACQATEQANAAGGGRVALSADLVDSAEGPRLRLRVTDDGVGIAPENLQRIFSHGFTTKKEGHGFGLHGAANAATEMGGRLSAESRGKGTGATFTLDIPVRVAAPTQDAAPAHVATAQEASCTK